MCVTGYNQDVCACVVVDDVDSACIADGIALHKSSRTVHRTVWHILNLIQLRCVEI